MNLNNSFNILSGIVFKDKKEYTFVDDINFNLIFKFENKNKVLFVNLTNIFIHEFEYFPLKDEFIDLVLEIKTKKEINKIVYIFNETCVGDTKEFDYIEQITNIKYFILNYDLTSRMGKNNLFYPASLYSDFKYLINSEFESAKTFLMNMNKEYRTLKKPYICSFYSNHVNPVRIDIFNILKKNDILKQSTWSFHKNEEYYSRDKHDVDKFYKENENLIPYSFDGFIDDKKTSPLKHTYFSQWMCYFEVLTESYFMRGIPNEKKYGPITEKLNKPILSALPFIIFGPKELKNELIGIGFSLNSPLYGFYDIADDDDIKKGLSHIDRQTKLSKEELHKIYFDYLQEYHDNLNKYFTFLVENLNEIKQKLEK